MPAQNDITARLAGLVEDSEIAEGDVATTAGIYGGPIHDESDPDFAAENPHLCYGRGPTGRLRNFRAMRDGKLLDTLYVVTEEDNDPEALTALRAEAFARNLL